MLDAGAVREMGSICSIKRVGEFGFIKSITRKDEIFFKLDDIVDQSVQVSEVSNVLSSLCIQCISMTHTSMNFLRVLR